MASSGLTYETALRSIVTGTEIQNDLESGALQSSLGHFPGQRWEFDEAVTRIFNDMLSRSIPHLDSMRDIVDRFSRRLIQPDTDIIDLGCAVGDGIARLLPAYETQNRFIGIECSESMLQSVRRRFLDKKCVEIRQTDLREDYPDARASLTLCILTLQFIPVEYRFRVLTEAHARTIPGGGMILVEKVLGETPLSNALLTDEYHRYKRAMGYSQEEVDAKRLALEGVLVPLPATWNEQLLRSAGFQQVECIWRSMNFSGWLALA